MRDQQIRVVVALGPSNYHEFVEDLPRGWSRWKTDQRNEYLDGRASSMLRELASAVAWVEPHPAAKK